MTLYYCREVTENEEFLALSASQVAHLISSDRLSVSSEEQVNKLFVISSWSVCSYALISDGLNTCRNQDLALNLEIGRRQILANFGRAE